MTQEAAFLAAIRDSPGDTSARLIYADWLDERNELRGELIRIEEEMRQLPVFSDRYWQLKPRRNELRAAAAPNWLEAMRYGTDCQPLFRHGVPDGWKERWRLIRERVEMWGGQLLPDVGGRLNDIRATEARLGRILPPSIREWVAFAHDVRRQERYFDVLREIYEMEELDGHSAVTLLLQCEGDYLWAIRHQDFVLQDPPVYDYAGIIVEDDDENPFVPAHDHPIAASLTEFVLDYAIGYTRGQGGGFATDVADPTLLIRNLKTTFPVHSYLGRTEFFEAENILVQLDPSNRSQGKWLKVEVAKPMPREAIPEFLWEYTRNGGSFHGMFTPRKNLRRAPSPSRPQDVNNAEEIPF